MQNKTLIWYNFYPYDLQLSRWTVSYVGKRVRKQALLSIAGVPVN
jgi:hypothetical protein